MPFGKYFSLFPRPTFSTSWVRQTLEAPDRNPHCLELQWKGKCNCAGSSGGGGRSRGGAGVGGGGGIFQER